MKQLMYLFFIIATVGMFLLVIAASCEESRKEPNVSELWGKGDPDPNHIKYFGNGNLSRLCFVQTQTINRQAKLIAELVNLNAKQHQILGKSDIELFNRVRKLEDPNAP